MKRVLGALAGFALGTAGVLVLLEVALRIAGFPTGPTMMDRTVGVRWRPGAHYRWDTEGFSEGRINRSGWRDRDYPVAKPPDTRRVLVLGDSFVQAMEVPLDSAFHKRLERDLQAHAAPGRRFEVLGLGRAGFGTTDAWVTYRRWGKAYDPDVVVLLFILNDWADNVPWTSGNWTRPYAFDAGDSLRLDTTFVRSALFRRQSALSWWKEHSSLANLVATRMQNLRAKTRPTSFEAGLTSAGGWYDVWNFDRSPAADSVPAMRLTAKILSRLAADVRADGRRFVLMVGGASENEAPEFLAERASDPNFDPDKTLRYLAALAERDRFEVLLLAPVMRRWLAAGGGRPGFGSGRTYGHWNELGHRIVARSLFDFLASELPDLLPVPGADSARARLIVHFGQSQPNAPPVSSP